MSEYGASGVSIRHCWWRTLCRGTNWNPVLSLARHWLLLGAWWAFLRESTTCEHLEEVVPHSCCLTPIFKQELTDYRSLSEDGAWEPNPPLIWQKGFKYRFSAQTTKLTHKSQTAAGERRGLSSINPLKWLHCARNFLTSEIKHKSKYKSAIWGLASCLGGSHFLFNVI